MFPRNVNLTLGREFASGPTLLLAVLYLEDENKATEPIYISILTIFVKRSCVA
jgi:hypothetical protein